MSSERTFIVWADPGLITGLAWYDLQKDIFNSWQYSIQDIEPQLDRLFLLADGRMAIGYERFIDTSGGRRTSSPESAHRAIRVIEGFAHKNTVPLLRPQPSSARTLGQVAWLRRLGWYRPGKQHANDAAQHVLACALMRRPMPQELRGRLFPKYKPRDTLTT